MDMTDTSAPEIKIRRTRKRLYDPLPEGDNKTLAASEHSTAQASEGEPSVLKHSAAQASEGEPSDLEPSAAEPSDEELSNSEHPAAQASEGEPSDLEYPVIESSFDESRAARADKIIKNYVLWSAGTALIPLPLVDFVAVAAIELKMLKKLSDHYEMEFSHQRGKSLIASLIGGVHARAFSVSLFKFIPVFGMTGAVVSLGALSGAVTYAVGKVFVQHFETGGTLLDFDPSKVKAFFAEKCREGRKAASDMQKPTA